MPTEQETINEAFEKYLSPSLTRETRQKIAEEYGKSVASKINIIYDDVMNAPVDWRTATVDSALPILHGFLETNYPWLSPDARKKLNYAFIMTWK